MKKLLALLLCLQLLVACGRSGISPASVPLETVGGGNTQLPVLQSYELPAIPADIRFSGEKEAAISSRGWIFIDDGGIVRVYNPASGTVNALCSDPLCSHLPDSDCAYRSCVFTGVPVQTGDRLWFVARDMWTNSGLPPARQVCSTDLFGGKRILI